MNTLESYGEWGILLHDSWEFWCSEPTCRSNSSSVGKLSCILFKAYSNPWVIPSLMEILVPESLALSAMLVSYAQSWHSRHCQLLCGISSPRAKKPIRFHIRIPNYWSRVKGVSAECQYLIRSMFHWLPGDFFTEDVTGWVVATPETASVTNACFLLPEVPPCEFFSWVISTLPWSSTLAW